MILARKARAAADVAIALRAVFQARRRSARTPVGSFVERCGELPKHTAQVMAAGRLSETEQRCGLRWAAAVDRVLHWVPGDSACLVRAAAIRELVRTRGLPDAEVQIGVRRGPGGFQAHAWVAQHGEPIAEPGELRNLFSRLDGVTIR